MVPMLDIVYSKIRIKQPSQFNLGCILEETMSQKSMAEKVVSKMNARLKFLHHKNKCLAPNLCHVLCNPLIQPHLNYARFT